MVMFSINLIVKPAFRIRGGHADLRILKQSDLQNFNKGFKLYQTQNIKKAHSLFEDIVANNPEDGVAKLYLDRCAKLLQTGWNSEIWDGVYRPQVK